MVLPITNLISRKEVVKKYFVSQKAIDIANDMKYNMGINSVDGYNHYYDQVVKSGQYSSDLMDEVGAYLATQNGNNNNSTSTAFPAPSVPVPTTVTTQSTSTTQNYPTFAIPGYVSELYKEGINTPEAFANWSQQALNNGKFDERQIAIIGNELTQYYAPKTTASDPYYTGEPMKDSQYVDIFKQQIASGVGSDNSQTASSFSYPGVNNTNTTPTNVNLAQMMASDPSAQGAFQTIKNLPADQQADAIANLPSNEMKEAYQLWSSSQTTTPASTGFDNTSTNTGTEWTAVPSNLTLTEQGKDLYGENTITVDSSVVNMIASDPSTQTTFENIKNMSGDQKAAALSGLSQTSPELRAAYDLWEFNQTSTDSTGSSTTTSSTSNSGDSTSSTTSPWSTTTSTSTTTTSTTGTPTSSTTSSSTTVTPTTSTTTSTSGIMKLNESTINDLIRNIATATQYLEDFVSKIESGEINTINNSWAANEASTYVSKVQAANVKIRKVTEGLNLLKNAYSKSLQESSSTQQDVSNVVNNI